MSVFPKLSKPTAYVQGSGLVADVPVINGFQLRLEPRTGGVTRRDYDSATCYLGVTEQDSAEAAFVAVAISWCNLTRRLESQ
nr:hypothetical protein [Pseudomonas syringae pv. coryli]